MAACRAFLLLDNTSSLSANVRPVQPWHLFSEYILSRQRQRTPQGAFSFLMHRYTSRADCLHITFFMLGSFVSCPPFLHSFIPSIHIHSLYEVLEARKNAYALQILSPQRCCITLRLIPKNCSRSGAVCGDYFSVAVSCTRPSVMLPFLLSSFLSWLSQLGSDRGSWA